MFSPVPLSSCILHIPRNVYPSTKQLYVKRGNLLYLTPRPEVKAKLEASEKDVGEKLAKMQKAAKAAAAAEAEVEASEPAARR